MRLIDIAAHVAEHGARRHLEKNGSAATPLAIGFNAVDIAGRVAKRYHDVEDQMHAVADKTLAPSTKHAIAMPAPGPSFGQQFGNMAGRAGSYAGQAAQQGAGKGIESLFSAPLGGMGKGVGDALGEGIKRLMFGQQLGERKDAPGMLAQGAIKSFGSALGTMGADLLQDMASKAMAAAGSAGDDAARKAILQQLKTEDAILSQANDAELMGAYHTMARFAPVLSTDKNAVRSFLRQAVMSGSGPDYMSIKLLADSERAVTGKGKE